MSKAAKAATAQINSFKPHVIGPSASLGGRSDFALTGVDVSGLIKVAETAVIKALKAEGIKGSVSGLELRIEFERRERQTQTTITGNVTLANSDSQS